ncbi:MAG TPA: hypothetical protein VFR97_10170, partial [Capillimicrobium sp.]|nr:hypothetical protein [Capillimicrobium sp.]
AEALGALHAAEEVGGAEGRVLLLSAPWDDDWLGALLARDAVLLHGGDRGVAALAAARLAARGAAARVVHEPPGPGVKAAAWAGLALPGTLRGLRAGLEVPS